VLRAKGVAPFRFYRGLLALDSLVDFFAVNGDVSGSVHTESRLIALDAEQGDPYTSTDHHTLTNTSG